MLGRAHGRLAAVALVAMIPGLIWAPAVTQTVLAVYGFGMLVVMAGVAARALGAARTFVRAALGASVGPWAALIAADMPTAAALELAVLAALLAVASANFTSRWGEIRRDGLLVFFGLADRDASQR